MAGYGSTNIPAASPGLSCEPRKPRKKATCLNGTFPNGKRTYIRKYCFDVASYNYT